MTAAPPSPPPAPANRPRGCLPTLAVLFLMLGIVGGGFAASRAVASLPPRPITVADGVIVRPGDGWEFGGRSDDGRAVVLSKGDGSVGITVTQGRPDPAAAIDALLAEWRAEPHTVMTSGNIEPSTIRAPQPAARASYSGTFEGINYPVEGEIIAVQGTANTVLFDAWAGKGDYAFVRPEIERLIRDAVIP